MRKFSTVWRRVCKAVRTVGDVLDLIAVADLLGRLVAAITGVGVVIYVTTFLIGFWTEYWHGIVAIGVPYLALVAVVVFVVRRQARLHRARLATAYSSVIGQAETRTVSPSTDDAFNDLEVFSSRLRIVIEQHLSKLDYLGRLPTKNPWKWRPKTMPLFRFRRIEPLLIRDLRGFRRDVSLLQPELISHSENASMAAGVECERAIQRGRFDRAAIPSTLSSLQTKAEGIEDRMTDIQKARDFIEGGKKYRDHMLHPALRSARRQVVSQCESVLEQYEAVYVSLVDSIDRLKSKEDAS